MLTNSDLTEKIIGAAIAVHKELGRGFLESIHEEALAAEFDAIGLPYERPMGEHRLDFLVAGNVVVELKAVRELEKIFFAIVRSYLKATRLDTGLLFNFAAMPLTIKRVGREDAARHDFPSGS